MYNYFNRNEISVLSGIQIGSFPICYLIRARYHRSLNNIAKYENVCKLRSLHGVALTNLVHLYKSLEKYLHIMSYRVNALLIELGT